MDFIKSFVKKSGASYEYETNRRYIMSTQYDTDIKEIAKKYNLSDEEMNDITSYLFARPGIGKYTTLEQIEERAKAVRFNKMMYGSLTSNETNTTQEVHNINTESREYENNNDGWCEIVSHEDLLTSKYFNSYAITVANSNYNQDKQDFRSYIYKEALDDRITKFLEEAKVEFPDGKIPAAKTVKNHIAELVKCKIPLETIKIEPTPNGVVYKLRNRVDNHWYVQLPYRQIRELVVATNRNMLKLFVVLKYTCNKDCKTFTTIDRAYLAREIGLSDKSVRGKDDISTMLVALAKLGYIEIRQETRTDYDETLGREIGKKINSYRLRSLEEYDEINLIARGRKPKK